MPPDKSPSDIHQRLVDQYTEIAQLAGGLAHEIRNPLSTIRLNMELLAEELADPENPKDRRAAAKIAVVQRECQRLQDLLDNFLDFAKVRSLNLRPTDLNAEVESLVSFYRPQASEAGIQVEWFPATDLPPALIDSEALRAALLNLVLNAQQAMPGGGTLFLRTRHTPTGIALELIDTGVGMDEKTSEQVFRAFFSTKRGGTGLGLPTARKIVEAHGGSISIQSAPGVGTQFTIELPVPQRLPAS